METEKDLQLERFFTGTFNFTFSILCAYVEVHNQQMNADGYEKSVFLEKNLISRRTDKIVVYLVLDGSLNKAE